MFNLSFIQKIATEAPSHITYDETLTVQTHTRRAAGLMPGAPLHIFLFSFFFVVFISFVERPPHWRMDGGRLRVLPTERAIVELVSSSLLTLRSLRYVLHSSSTAAPTPALYS
ncbi:hypothetical protein OUZ56_000926 [Daphnia magna]|uniref:Uncharacterized protein n=1 Tax=Daphnia magna TaxID=35525 RepID=A0ABR0A166_9CRUS|nr:hypothetical protein OUZ56_000926 [Daphnia magna]